MKEQFKCYLETIGASQKLIERAELLLEEAQSLYSIEMNDIIVCSYIREQQEEFTSLWFITTDKLIECKNFLTETDIDLARYANNIKYFNLISKDYKVNEVASNASNVRVSLVLNDGLTSEFQASGKNCEYLVRFAQKYLIPHVI